MFWDERPFHVSALTTTFAVPLAVGVGCEPTYLQARFHCMVARAKGTTTSSKTCLWCTVQ